MNTDKAAKDASQLTTELQKDPLVEVIDVLKSVKTTGKQAKKNAVAMDDNNGGTIWYNWLFKNMKFKKK